MRVVIQRVKRASVTVVNEDASTSMASEIGRGLVCLVGIREGDAREHAEWICKQIVGAKLFEGMTPANADKRWRSNVKQNGFEILLVSQFTLNGRVCSKGKVDFAGSMPPGEARAFYDRFVEMVQAAHRAPELVKDGVFGAKMEVSLVNDGPITVIVDSSEMKEGSTPPSSEAALVKAGVCEDTGVEAAAAAAAAALAAAAQAEAGAEAAEAAAETATVAAADAAEAAVEAEAEAAKATAANAAAATAAEDAAKAEAAAAAAAAVAAAAMEAAVAAAAPPPQE